MKKYRKHFIPLESNPDLFTALIHELGAPPSLSFQDVLSLDDPDLLSFLPRPVLALVLVFPCSGDYEEALAEKDKNQSDYSKCGDEESVIWYRQTIHNACGLYGILHAVSNGRARESLVPDSHLDKLIQTCSALGPDKRAFALEDDSELEAAYKVVALQGQTEAPENAEDEVDFHYVCFAKSSKDGHLYELDGDRKGPVDLGSFSGDDLLSEDGIRIVKEFIDRAASGLGFSLLALVSST